MDDDLQMPADMAETARRHPNGEGLDRRPDDPEQLAARMTERFAEREDEHGGNLSDALRALVAKALAARAAGTTAEDDTRCECDRNIEVSDLHREWCPQAR